VPKRFLSPPREFKKLYGAELRQTTMDNFVSFPKIVPSVIVVKERKKRFVQSCITKYLKCKK
jgi:hypothetical protein